MAIYAYKALDAAGKEVSGKIDAASEKVANQRLREQNMRPFELKMLADKAEGGGGGFTCSHGAVVARYSSQSKPAASIVASWSAEAPWSLSHSKKPCRPQQGSSATARTRSSSLGCV